MYSYFIEQPSQASYSSSDSENTSLRDTLYTPCADITYMRHVQHILVANFRVSTIVV